MSESNLQLDLTAPNGRQISLNRGLFIDNKFVLSTGGESLRPIDPTTEAEICQVDAANADDIDRAVKAAQRALVNPSWRDISGTERGAMMTRLADLMEQNQEFLATLESWNAGKPYTSVLNLELPAAIGCIRYYAGWADKLHGQTIPTHSKKFAYTVKQPIGVCGQIIPWNYPVLMAAWKLGPALATGNTIVLKPAEQTPLSMLYVAGLIVRAGFPPGVVNIVNGYGKTAGHALVSHPNVAKIAFTGSTITGRLIQQTAGATLKKVTLETGGKSPLLVFNDADIEQAAKWAHCGIMSNQGQICTANSRLLVQSGVYKQFIKRFVELVEAHKIGNPFHENTFQGPQITKAHLEKILCYTKSAVEEGATLETGGGTWGKKGFFMQPTVFSNVSSSMKIYREEIFGPVVAISSFDEEEAAINMANDSEFGLAASVFTRDMQRSHRVSTRLDAGMVWVNSSTDSDFRVPFGGMKQSGVGRELGEAGLEGYMQVKSVHVNVGLEL
ncbi:aldehyde dehydrogenase domain-containing protein [Fusarium solani]|uniref:aldehyde dehydrogenase (NAD(+)) n=1 Tax=Fusarium solani TaxID=169388 RepID=A0A9P9R6W8_FUSSL|nr:aldehyde dehydrogenase domain-containing protein [Fusarium solani]KAH7268611.1 aldehyde dehydrogenase domain-containing protein [Fusarium solani]